MERIELLHTPARGLFDLIRCIKMRIMEMYENLFRWRDRMKNRKKTGFKAFLYWPLILCAMLVIANVLMYFIDRRAAFLLMFFTIAFAVITLVIFFANHLKIKEEIMAVSEAFAEAQSRMLDEIPVPYCILAEEGRILWVNRVFLSLVGQERVADKKIFAVLDGLTEDRLVFDGKESVAEIEFKGRNYSIHISKLFLDKEERNEPLAEGRQGPLSLISLSLFDETEIVDLRKENFDQKFVAGLLYLDNYEEVMETVEDVRKSLILALIDRRINKYFSAMDGVVRKLEKDKYFIVLKQQYITLLQTSKFDLLDEVKAINIGNEMPVTVSIGLGVGGDTFNRSCEFSRTAIDLALGRGGDQAVIKDGDRIYYYGGKTRQVEKNTRVKARVKAHALRELLSSKDDVLIMGHKMGDIDSIGAAIGIYRVAKSLNRKAHIVIGELTNPVKPLIAGFKADSEYEEDLFINGTQAMQIMDENTVLVMVDVNKPSYAEEPGLAAASKATVILDHHRQSSETADNAVLSYIEPYASSTCEMVAEILQYISDDIRIKQAEADVLYAGIMIDTNYFMINTGVRTFEAAAFLKRKGADINKVRMQFRDGLDDFKAMAVTYHNAEVFQNHFIIGECPPENLQSPTVTAARAANEMLAIRGIKASFVVTGHNDTVYISARSTDEVNVQLIMERLGGGGHLNIAGAQLSGKTVEEAIQIVKETLIRMKEEGDI